MSDKDSKGELKPMTDLDLPPAHRTEANLWKSHTLVFMRELVKANKGIRRLRNKVDRLKKSIRPITPKEEGDNVFVIRLLGNALIFLDHHPMKIISSNPIGSAISLIEDAIKKLSSPPTKDQSDS